MLHAADVEALQAAKEQVSKMAALRQHLEETAQKAETQLLEGKASWEERERMLKVPAWPPPGVSPSVWYLVRRTGHTLSTFQTPA